MFSRTVRFHARVSLTVAVLSPAVVVAACGDDTEAGGLSACAITAAEATAQCVRTANAAWAACVEAEGACPGGGDGVTAALATLRQGIEDGCLDGEFLSLSVDALAGRLENACASESASLAWRSFGGPQAAAYLAAGPEDQACLRDAHRWGSVLVEDLFAEMGQCLASGACNTAEIDEAREMAAAFTRDSVAEACAASALENLVAVSPAVFVERAEHQADCLAAASFPRTAPLSLSCGPSNVDFDAPRGEYVEVVVDEAKWGTRCGDGSPYAFHVRLAPEGARLDRVLVGLQGGGVCVFEEDCASRIENAPGLLTAMDDGPPTTGIFSTDPEVSPFADWTLVYLPYCNQDVFAGGGVVENLGSVQLPRFGAVNLRAAVRMVRDLLWKSLDGETDRGFRPDELVALFGGWSAGGYGTLYNYHWFLDDLQWPRTAAFPDAGMALDNGDLLGVGGLGLIKVPAWGTRPNLPPYCFDADCAIGPVLYEALSPRLESVPEQQMLVVSNPRDRTQQRDAFFGGEDDEARWINAVRQSYCDTRDLAGIHYYLTSVSDESVHVVTLRPELWSAPVDGVVMRDWFERAVTDPEALEDRVEEAGFVEEVPGVEPFPCAL